jgi:hypothetical protein
MQVEMDEFVHASGAHFSVRVLCSSYSHSIVEGGLDEMS